MNGFYRLYWGLLLVLLLCGCSGSGSSSDSPPPAPDTEVDNLTVADIGQVIAQAVEEARARGVAATVAVTDRVGNVLGVFRMDGARTQVRVSSERGVDGGLEDIAVIPDTLAAIAKAVTGAYLSTQGNAFTTRTASQIVQEHFNPGEINQPGGPLFGVQFSSLPCSDLVRRFPADGTPGPKRSPLGLAADPGGLPLYKDGVAVGGVGVMADGLYGLDPVVTDRDLDADELIATAATVGFRAPQDIRADRITVDGKLLRFADAEVGDLVGAPAAPPFAAIDGVLGNLVAVPGYSDGTLIPGAVFGEAASGVRADTALFPGRDAFVLVDAANNVRFPPRTGARLGGLELTAEEVQVILDNALAVANRARAQIRRPLGDRARVSIFVVDTEGAVLGMARSRDAPVFGLDVALQKARTAAFLSSPQAADALREAPDAVYLDSDGSVERLSEIGDYVAAARAFTGNADALADGIAFSDRAGGNLSRPFFPDGIRGNPNGPFSLPFPDWSPFATGLQLDLSLNGILAHVLFVLGAAPDDVGDSCSVVLELGGADPGRRPVAAIPNGIQIFPGSVPIYRDDVLVGGIGVSGDGIDQDDLVAFLGLHNAGLELNTGVGNAPPAIRADTLVIQGVRLRYVQCPFTPFLDTNEQDVCEGL